MFSMEQIGKKIINFRKEKNMTQTELADIMNVSFQAVSNWERGNSMPDISKLPQLAELLGCSVDELLNENAGLLQSAIKDELKEYVEKNDIAREELEVAVSVLKPDQLEQIAEGLVKTKDQNINIFYPFLDNNTRRELAEQKIAKGEEIWDMLAFLDKDSIREFAMQREEQGKTVKEFYPFMQKDDLRELAVQKIAKGEEIRDMLPFLGSDFLRILVMGKE